MPNVGLVEKELTYEDGLNWHIYKLKKAIINNKLITAISENRTNSELPKRFLLAQNYPNPFYSKTLISYRLVQQPTTKISLKIYNLIGQEIKTLVDGFQAPGFYRFLWDGKNDFGEKLPTGAYRYMLKGEDFREGKKMVLH